jgi:hypothetical protein
MNQTIKSAIPPIKAPQAAKTAAPVLPVRLTNTERMERALVGKYFHFLYAQGARFRAGRFESVVADGYLAVRYFAMRDGSLQKWTHVVRMYDCPSMENLTGFWIHDSEADLKETYEGFLRAHLKAQEEKREQQKEATIE